MIGLVVSHYRVVDRLGAGGMGVVYRAEDMRLGRHVALKFLPESVASDPLATERFQREARTTSALNHPNICTLHDVGESDGRRFIVMELIDGATLDKVLGAGALPVDRVIDIAINVADALDAAHSEGILHRDIKPGNIFITRRGQVKVVDFGLAKMMPHRGGLTPIDVTIAEQHALTSAGMAVGTVAYMSPEHARGEAVDQRSDLFSLGVVMYEMSTGVQTFKGQTTAVIFDQILNRIPVPPSHINPDVIPSLELIIARLLEKDRERRYQSARDVQYDLQRLKRDLETGRVLAAEAAQTTVPATWAPLEKALSAQTAAVNLPTFGVDADPAPVPAAWAAGWEQVRPSSKPENQRTGPAGAEALNRSAVAAPAAPSGEVSASAPTVMLPASGASHAAAPPVSLPPALPPGLPPASAATAIPDPSWPADFETMLANVPHAPDAETMRANSRRETLNALASDSAAEPNSVPAVWSTPPPLAAPAAASAPQPAAAPTRPAPARSATTTSRPGSSSRALALAGAAVVVVSLAIGGAWWVLQRHEVPVSSAPPPPVAAPTPAPAPPPSETIATADPFETAAGSAPAAPAAAPATPTVPATTRRSSAAGTSTAAAAKGTPSAIAAVPPPAPAPVAHPSKALNAQAATMLSEAQGLLQTGAEADGLAKIAALRASFSGTPAAHDGAILAARTHQNARRYAEAAAAWIDAAREGVSAEDVSEGLIQAADGAARLRTGDGDVLARRALGDLLDHYPASVRALRALQMKMTLEDRMKLKEPDSELNGMAPSSLLTLRQAARAGGTAPVAEFALWRLAQEYRDRRLYELAAATFIDLGTRFPETRYDAWFSAAELYEKQLKDAARAREAYGKVPAASPRYEAAQKKLASA